MLRVESGEVGECFPPAKLVVVLRSSSLFEMSGANVASRSEDLQEGRDVMPLVVI